MKRQRLRGRQKMRAIHKMAFIAAGASILGLAAYLTLFINTSQVEESNAGLMQNMMLGYDINSGDVIAAYNFDEDILKAEAGPDAIAVSKEAKLADGGADNTKGLTPGTTMTPLNFIIPAVKELNLGGIDMAMDYRRSDDNCNLFSRGRHFNIGVKNGKIAVMYKVRSKSKRTTIVMETTRYEVPADDEFRTYRFVYDPVKGRSEFLVNGVVIWSKTIEPQTNLTWKDKDPLIVGKDLKGDGSGKVYVDNVIVRATRQSSLLPVTLLNFEARAEKDHVMISWYTGSESEIDSFIVERSTNAKSYTEVGRVKAVGGENILTAYAVVDSSPTRETAYYRLVPSNKPLKSMTISTIGYRYRGTGGDLKLSDVVTEGEVIK